MDISPEGVYRRRVEEGSTASQHNGKFRRDGYSTGGKNTATASEYSIH